MNLKNGLAKASNVFMLSFLLPFVYGCNGGGGGSASAAGLSGDSLQGAGSDGGTALAQIYNPEPATMFLLGSGILAMKYLSSRKSSKR